MTIQDLQPYFAAVSAALSVATLGFLINLVKAVRDNAQGIVSIKDERLKAAREIAQDQLAAKDERLKGVVDDHARLKDWAEREKAELKTKLVDRSIKEVTK